MEVSQARCPQKAQSCASWRSRSFTGAIVDTIAALPGQPDGIGPDQVVLGPLLAFSD
jgi:hypothetical protein